MEALFDRLLDLAAIDTEKVWAWPGSELISVEEIREAWADDVSGDSTPYGDSWRHPVRENRDKEYHIARIIYFAEHPEEISGIEVDNPCYGNMILPGCVINDGWHRLVAGILLGIETVEIDYGGRCDIEDYLTGKTDVRPEESF